MKIVAVNQGIYHIYEQDPSCGMLYRYGILKKDVECENDGGCRLDAGVVRLDAKRPVAVEIDQKDRGYGLKIGLSQGERLFGGGDATREEVMLRGMKINMNIGNVVSYGPMPILLSTDGWAIALNCTYQSVFDCGATEPDQVRIETAKGAPDFYLFRGDSLQTLLAMVTSVTGRAAMLPKFGYGLTFVQNELVDARSMLWDIRALRDHDIPCDTMGLEPDWMDTHYDYSVDKKWSPDRFPLPSWRSANDSGDYTFFYPMRRMGMQLSLWLCENYDLLYYEDQNCQQEAQGEHAADAVIQDAHLLSSHRIDNMTKPGEPWFEHLKKFVDNGAAAFKLDGSTQVLFHPDRLWGGKYTDDEVHNIYPVLLAKQMTQGFRDYTDRRLMLYSAGAYTGVQQFAATWAGDTGGGLKTLVSLMNYAMCGHSNTACDIEVSLPGLHYGFLIPWSQYFCWANWRYPWFMGEELENAVRFYANLRSSLVPYLYTMAHKAYETGLPMLRPLPLVYEQDAKLDRVKNAYMLGDCLYVGVFDMDLVLPEGRWVDYFTGDVYEGQVSYSVPEGKGGALFVREGSVFVTMKPQKYVLEKQHDYIINLYPGGDSAFCLYEDDGFTYDYQEGKYAQTRIEMTNSGENGCCLRIYPREGGYPGRPENGHDIVENSIPEIKPLQPEKDMQVQIHNRKPARIVLEGQEVDFVWDGRKAIFTAPTQSRGNRMLSYDIYYDHT